MHRDTSVNTQKLAMGGVTYVKHDDFGDYEHSQGRKTYRDDRKRSTVGSITIIATRSCVLRDDMHFCIQKLELRFPYDSGREEMSRLLFATRRRYFKGYNQRLQSGNLSCPDNYPIRCALYPKCNEWRAVPIVHPQACSKVGVLHPTSEHVSRQTENGEQKG